MPNTWTRTAIRIVVRAEFTKRRAYYYEPKTYPVLQYPLFDHSNCLPNLKMDEDLSNCRLSLVLAGWMFVKLLKFALPLCLQKVFAEHLFRLVNV